MAYGLKPASASIHNSNNNIFAISRPVKFIEKDICQTDKYILTIYVKMKNG